MKIKKIAFDLETIADKEALALLPPADPKIGNLKDPEKIKAKVEAVEKDRVSKAGLNPHHNMIAAVGWCDGTESGCIFLEDESAEGEAILLAALWEKLNAYDHFITFNGNAFDVPIIKLHSLFRRIRPAIDISTKKYVIKNHIDLRMVLGNWDAYAPGNLDFYLRRCLGRSKPETIDGSMVQDFWDNGLGEDIARYAEQDAIDTWDLHGMVCQYYPM